MKVYFDTEFTGLRKDTTLISIGLVTENGKCFYGIFTDYNKELCNHWISEHVIKNLHIEDNAYLPDIVKVEGTKDMVAKQLEEWLRSFNEDIQLVSDVCHYDMTLFIDLFGGAFDLPKYISPVCHDINQEIAHFYDISDKEAFDKSREEIVGTFKCNMTRLFSYSGSSKMIEYLEIICNVFRACEDMNNKHNALFDALEIFLISIYLDYKSDYRVL